jgi:hypothetical protein
MHPLIDELAFADNADDLPHEVGVLESGRPDRDHVGELALKQILSAIKTLCLFARAAAGNVPASR